jgi:hypothetical protein
MNQFSPYGIPSFQGAVVEPPSFEPQIASLGQMIDTFTQRRIKMAQEEERNQAAQDEVDRKLAWDKEKEAYGRRKQDIAEKKVDSEAQYKRMVANQSEYKRAHTAIGSGQDPGTSIMFDETTGEPVKAQWKFQGAQPQAPVQPPVQAPAPATPPPPTETPQLSNEPSPNLPAPQEPVHPPPTLMGRPLAAPTVGQGPGRLPPPVVSAAPNGQTQIDPQLEALMAQAHGQEPQEPQPQVSPNTIFLDENDEGTTRALSGPDDMSHRELPIEAYPPGAKEGDRFNAEDVNLTGGKGNPFAGPVEPPQASVLSVPPRQIQGMSAQMPQGQTQVEKTAGGKWVAVTEDGRILGEIDPGQARAARAAENAQDLRDIDVALADPSTAHNPQLASYFAIKKQALLASMSPAEIKQVYSQAGKAELQGNQIASNEGMQADRIGAQKDMNSERLDAQKEIAAGHDATKRATSKYGHGGGAGKAPTMSSGQGSAFSRLKPMEQARVENAVSSGINAIDRSMNWTNLEGKGFDRLDLALKNIRDKGDLGGAPQMEAMMNFFGYIRGGVPAKNETDEFKSQTRTLGTMLDSLGQKVGVKDLWTNFTGSDADKEAIAKIAHLPEGQRAGLEHAIVQSKEALQGMAVKNIQAEMENYKSAGQAFHERVQDRINGKMRFIGAQPRQWFADSPLIPDFNATTPGGGEPSGGSIMDILKGLKR